MPQAAPKTRNGWAAKRADVQAHADRDQEYADKQAFERLDRDLDLPAIFRAGQQQPADQRAESHREAGSGSGKAGRDHHQQARRHKQFRALRARHAAEQRAQHQPAEGDDRRRPPARPGRRQSQ